MLDIQLLRNDLEGVAKRLATRGISAPTEEFLRLESARKQVQTRTQELQNRRNIVSKQVGEAKRKGEDAAALMAEAAALPDLLKGPSRSSNRSSSSSPTCCWSSRTCRTNPCRPASRPTITWR